MNDPFLWLEELTSTQSLDWVHQQNQKTLQKWTQNPRFESFQSQALHIHSQKDKPLIGSVYRGWIYQILKDVKNPLGVFRRAPLESFSSDPQWEVLFDLDLYSQEKGRPLFLKDYQFLLGTDRLLLSLSPDGKDAAEIFEWDLEAKSFVQDGFVAPLQKSEMTWVDQDFVFWASSERPTHCGYPSQVYSWKRDSKPELVYEIPTTSMSAWPMVFRDSKQEPQVYLAHVLNWDDGEIYYWENKKWIFTGFPLSARMHGFYQDRVVLTLEKAWNEFPAGSVLISKVAGKFHSFQSSDFEMIFAPTAVCFLQYICTYKEGVAIFFTDNLRNKIDIWTTQGLMRTAVPEGVSVSGVFSSLEEDQLFTRFHSFTQPMGWYRLDGQQWKNLQQSKAYFQTDSLVAKQEWAQSPDGTQVPYWVVYNKNFSLPQPALQYGYGGFANSEFPFFSNIYGSLWLEKGGLYVLAQIRGGYEFGVPWHEAAKLENKQKSYDDFIAVSEDLISKGYTTARQLAIRGRSNGGLLVGATVTQRPDLYGAALIEVPLLDMIRYVELPPGSSWIGEYGDPRDPKFREIILKYSPYQNVEKNPEYPPILIRTARSDDRVHPGHARKMAAKLQSLGHQAWYFEEELGGHGSTPVKDLAFQEALVFEFFWSHLADS